MADDNGGITYDGDVSNEELGKLKDSTKAEQQSNMRVAAAAAAFQRESEQRRQQAQNSQKSPAKTNASLRSSDLRSVAQSQTSPRDPGSPQMGGGSQNNQATARLAQAIAASRSQHAPATVSEPKHVSRAELGALRVQTKAQMQSQLLASSYSPEKQQRVANQMQQVQARAMNYVRGQTAKRGPNLKTVAQSQQQSPPSVQTKANNLAQVAAKSGQQQARGPNVFDRYALKQAQSNSLRQVAQTQAKAAEQAKAQPAKEQTQQQKAAANVFDKHKQPREKGKEQQQEKEKGRGR